MTDTKAPILNVEQFRENYADLKEIVPALIASFHSSYQAQVSKIGQAIEQNDPTLLKSSAHSLKGVLLQLYASSPGQLALELEQIGRSGKVEGARELFERLKSELPILMTSLDEVVKSL